jgi:hypothetical protein
MKVENVQLSTSNVQRSTGASAGARGSLLSKLNVERWTLKVLLAPLLLSCLTAAASAQAADRASVIVAIGAPGDDAYQGVFERWGSHWKKAAAAGDARCVEIGAEPNSTDSLARLRDALKTESADSPNPLWLVLLGHGTFDGKEAKFNLRGDDLAVSDLAEWLRPFHRPVVVVCGFSASGAFLKPLSGADRVIVTATKSGSESNFARFGGYFSESIADPSADLDKDGETSVLEAWLAAARRAADFYKNEGRLATEHALLDDNGDGFGTPPDWFQGVRAVKRAKNNQPPDGLRAHQIHLVASAAERALSPTVRAERDEMERELAKLRDAKAAMPEDEYFTKLEEIMLRIARLYQRGTAP